MAGSNHSMMQEKRTPLGRRGQTGSSAQAQGQQFIHGNAREGQYHDDTDSADGKTCSCGSSVLAASIFSEKSSSTSKNGEGAIERGGGAAGLHVRGVED